VEQWWNMLRISSLIFIMHHLSTVNRKPRELPVDRLRRYAHGCPVKRNRRRAAIHEHILIFLLMAKGILIIAGEKKPAIYKNGHGRHPRGD